MNEPENKNQEEFPDSKKNSPERDFHDTNEFFFHSPCCGLHWKLSYHEEVKGCLLECLKCHKPLAMIQKPNLAEFHIDPCPCGCGDYAIFPKCCNRYQEPYYNRSFWELIYNKKEGILYIECERCGTSTIEIARGFLEDIKCAHENPVYVRDDEGIATIDPEDIEDIDNGTEVVAFKIDENGPDTPENWCTLQKRFVDEILDAKKNNPQKYKAMIKSLKETSEFLHKGKIPSFWSEEMKDAYEKRKNSQK